MGSWLLSVHYCWVSFDVLQISALSSELKLISWVSLEQGAKYHLVSATLKLKRVSISTLIVKSSELRERTQRISELECISVACCKSINY